jgi:hypothetical protein
VWLLFVQRMVLQHIKPDTILVGHALENDLKALRVSALQSIVSTSSRASHTRQYLSGMWQLLAVLQQH